MNKEALPIYELEAEVIYKDLEDSEQLTELEKVFTAKIEDTSSMIIGEVREEDMALVKTLIGSKEETHE